MDNSMTHDDLVNGSTVATTTINNIMSDYHLNKNNGSLPPHRHPKHPLSNHTDRMEDSNLMNGTTTVVTASHQYPTANDKTNGNSHHHHHHHGDDDSNVIPNHTPVVDIVTTTTTTTSTTNQSSNGTNNESTVYSVIRNNDVVYCNGNSSSDMKRVPTLTTTTPPKTQPQLRVASDRVQYTDDTIIANYTYQTTVVHENYIIEPIVQQMIFRTERHVPKIGVMLVGLGGNNGSTCVAGTIANRLNLTWETKSGIHTSNYLGSIFQSSTTKIGNDYNTGHPIYKPLHTLLPMIHPNDIVWSGWDINNMNLGDAMKRAQVLDYDLQQKLYPYMKDIIPLPSIYLPDFIAANQSHRANNVLSGTKYEQMNTIRQNIRDFRIDQQVDKVIVVWSANTERFTNIQEGIHDTAEHLMTCIQQNDDEISASTLFAVASILEHCTFINGSPQNTFVPGVIELALQHNVFIAGDDFKSGQTKMKSVLVDFLVTAGIKPLSIVSYNHLGNNDGKNLSAPSQFRSKEISKSNVVDDMVASNSILYPNVETDHPDHVVVIKYVPAVADSKRAMDEYTSEIFMGGKNTIVIHNTCEDSLLATPLIYDLIILAELCERITVKITPNNTGDGERVAQFESFHPVLSLLSYLLKAPLVPDGTPIVNALFPQREAITNVLRACLGLPPNNHMTLEHRFCSSIREQQSRSNVIVNNDSNLSSYTVKASQLR